MKIIRAVDTIQEIVIIHGEDLADDVLAEELPDAGDGRNKTRVESHSDVSAQPALGCKNLAALFLVDRQRLFADDIEAVLERTQDVRMMQRVSGAHDDLAGPSRGDHRI